MSDRSELVDVEFDKLVRQSKPGQDDEGAFLVEIGGDEYWVAKTQVNNADDIIEDLGQPAWKRSVNSIEVPQWLAQDNGWID